MAGHPAGDADRFHWATVEAFRGSSAEAYPQQSVMVLLDETPASWRALHRGLSDASRDGSAVSTVVVRHRRWFDGLSAQIVPEGELAACVAADAACREVVGEFAGVLAPHGIREPDVVSSRQELLDLLVARRVNLVVAGERLGRRVRRWSTRLGVSLLIVP